MSGVSFLYVVHCQGRYKIGFANNLPSRVCSIQTDNPFPVRLEAFMRVHKDHVKRLEAGIHDHLRGYRERGEWFKAPLSAILRAAELIAEGLQMEGDCCWKYGSVPRPSVTLPKRWALDS